MTHVLRPHHYVLIVLLALTLFAGMNVESIWTERHYEFLPEMVTSVPVDAQTPRWLQAMHERGEGPAAGTVPVSDTLSGSSNPFEEWIASPAVPATDDTVVTEMGSDGTGSGADGTGSGADETEARLQRARDRGADRYRVFCAPCHGSGGAGDGAVSKRGMPPPPSLLADNARLLADTALYRIISDGRVSMPGYASQLRPVDRWNIILALRAMQGKPSTAGGTTP